MLETFVSRCGLIKSDKIPLFFALVLNVYDFLADANRSESPYSAECDCLVFVNLKGTLQSYTYKIILSVLRQ